MEKKESKTEKPTALLVAGFAAGTVVTGLLNPVDRALFLSVSNRSPFLDAQNWRQPFQGLGQSIVSRAISTGLWFPLERLALQSLEQQPDVVPPAVAALVAGQAAGAANALLLSPLAFVKYQTWGRPDGKRGFASTSRKIYFTAGVGAFFRGLPATVLRDMIFGGCFGSLRTTLRSQAESRNAPKSSEGALQTFAADFVAAAAATALSSPINYARNLQFGTKLTDAVPSTAAAVQGLADEAASQPTTLGRVNVLLQRTNIGWGTLRVAGGMALTARIFAGFVGLVSYAT